MTLDVPCAVCTAPIHREPSSDELEWVWADAGGARYADAAPAGSGDPAWWAKLPPATYSLLTALIGVGTPPWWHEHRPGAELPPYDGPVPECCESPMRLAPAGWICRRSTHDPALTG